MPHKPSNQVTQDQPDFSSRHKKRLPSRANKRWLVRRLSWFSRLQGEGVEHIRNYMGCALQRVTEIEAGCDQDLRLGELCDYLEALGLGLSLTATSTPGLTIDLSVADKVSSRMARRPLAEAVAKECEDVGEDDEDDDDLDDDLIPEE